MSNQYRTLIPEDQMVIEELTGQIVGMRSGATGQIGFFGGQASTDSSGNINGLNFPGKSTYKIRTGPPTGVVLAGDSRTAMSNSVVNVTVAATIGQALATVTLAAHSMGPGQRCELNGALQPEFNGIQTCVSITDVNNFVVTLNAPATATTPGGYVNTLGTVTHGTLYTNGTYTNVPLTGGTGSGAIATIVVSGGGVQTVQLTSFGGGYTVSDSLSASAANIGGTGSGFSVPVASVGTMQVARGNTFGSTGYWQYISGLKLSLLNNAGLGGDTAGTAIAVGVPGLGARLSKDVFPYNPNLVIMSIGINDIPTRSASQIATDIISIANSIIAQNIPLVLASLPPTGPGWGNYSTANSQKIIEVNRQLKYFAENTQGVVYSDIHSALVDPTSTVGAVLAANTADGIHNSSTGANIESTVHQTSISSFGVPKISLIGNSLDCILNDPSSFNIMSNSLLLGSGSAASGGVTGTCPTGWTISGAGGGSQAGTLTTPARTVAADGDTNGNNIVVAFTSAANNDSLTIRTNSTSWASLQNGQWLYADLDIGWKNSTNLKYITAYIVLVVAGVNYQSYFSFDNDSTNMTPTFRGSVKIPALYIPATGAIQNCNINVQAFFNGAGGSTVQVGRVSLKFSPTLAAIN